MFSRRKAFFGVQYILCSSAVSLPLRRIDLADITEEVTRKVGYLELIKGNANFRNLWFGQIISLLGDWFNLIASASLISMLTQSGLAVGGLFVVRMLAQFLSSPVGGVLADRYNRKKLLIIFDLSRGFIVLGFLLVRSPDLVWFLYILTAAQLAFSGMFFPTRNAILPDLVHSGELGAANALTSATWSTMLAFGAALGGLVAGEWGLQPSFIIDSFTFFCSAFFISRLVYQKSQISEETGKNLAAIFVQYAEGLKYLNKQRQVLMIAMQKASISLAMTSIFQIIQVTISSQIFVIGEGGSTGLGLIYAMVGIGTGFGPIIARRYIGDSEARLRKAVALGYLVGAIGVFVVSTLHSFAVVLLGTLFRGLGSSLIWVFSTQLLLQIIPNRVRGRVFSTEYAIMTLMSAFASAMGGWIFDNTQITVPQMLMIMSGMALLFGSIWASIGLLKPLPDVKSEVDQPIAP
jgi:MFS family permease